MPFSGPKGAVKANTYLAGAPIIRYRAVQQGADVNSVIQSVANSVPIGVAEENQQTAARSVRIVDRAGEEVMAEAGASFAYDALLTSDINARLIAAVSTNNVVAIARGAAGALGDLVPVEIAQRGYLAP
jgi:hypothetical protein